jgi:phage-related minor tail protein
MDELASLAGETARLRGEMAELTRLGANFGSTIARAFGSAIVDGKKLGDVLKGLALSLSRQALTAALKPLGSLLGGLFANAEGNVISAGRIVPFADGGIVNSPALFPLRGGAGLAGEAGPEAILPLARGADGKLGVRGGGRAMNITVNIATPDAQSFAASQSQVAALIARAAARGQRNL